VEGVGGELTLIARFPDRPPVILSGFGLGDERGTAKKKAAKKAARKTAGSPKSKTGTRRAAGLRDGPRPAGCEPIQLKEK